MCPPKVKTPEKPAPPPAAPPPASETATGFASASTDDTGNRRVVRPRRSIDSLRVDLAVPGSGASDLRVP